MGDAYYSDIAPGYDALYGEEQDGKLREFLERVELPLNGTLLDVGCGTGRSAQLLDDIHWHGVEPSDGLIGQAAQSLRLRIQQGVAENIPFPDASFDVVLSLTAIQNFDDPEKALMEMQRVCKSGGSFLLSCLKKSSKADMIDALIRKRLSVVDSWSNSKDAMYICS